jgi:hypothetical protein
MALMAGVVSSRRHVSNLLPADRLCDLSRWLAGCTLSIILCVLLQQAIFTHTKPPQMTLLLARLWAVGVVVVDTVVVVGT